MKNGDINNKKNLLPPHTVLYGNSYQYKIIKSLGQGTFGITYLASVKMAGALGTIDTNIMVAIKEFFMRDINGRSEITVTSGSQGGIYDDYKKKFIREALNLSRLQHPNIVKVIESFEANNTVYYAMEYISGGSLDNYIAKSHGLKETETIRIVKQVGSALAYMHDQGMLHLDLKPSNIMMKDTGEAVLIDFGLSKQYEESGEPESSTKVGAGTPGYAPIEQANYREGKDFPVTMDIYALGGTMFKMLTGKRPPEASDILNEGFPVYELQEHKVCDNISACIAKAMAPAKKDRYQAIAEFINSFNEEVTVIDAEMQRNNYSQKANKIKDAIIIDGGKQLKKESPKPNVPEKIFNVRPDTSMVRIEFWPHTLFPPQFNGAFITLITAKEVIPNITQKSTYEKISLTQSKFQNFLQALQALNIRVREKTDKSFVPSSFEPAKLKIVLYDSQGVIYNDLWTDSMGGGNIIGNVDVLEKSIIRLVPGLSQYLNGPYYETPDLFKMKELERGLIGTNLCSPPIRYRWLFAVFMFLLEIGVAFVMLGTCSRDLHLDSDGRILLWVYLIVPLAFTYYLSTIKDKVTTKKWKLLTILSVTLCIMNSLLLPIWNGSLTEAYLCLSLGLSVVSSYAVLIKKILP